LQGRLLLQLGKYEDAVLSLKTALDLDPDSSDTLVYLSLAHEALGHDDEAEAVCRQAIERHPDDWRSGYNRLGVLLFRRGAVKEAIEMWEALIARAPDNPRGHVNLGAAYFNLGKLALARAAYERALAIVPNAPACAGLGTVSYFEGDYAAAAAGFERAIALRPHDPRYWAYLGDAQRWLPGKTPESESAFDRALELTQEQLHFNPQDGDAWARLGSWLAKRGRFREALAATERALGFNPRSVLCAGLSVTAYFLAGEMGRAMERLREALQRGYGTLALEKDPWLEDLWNHEEARQILRGAHPIGET
jgi:tetratricopeptide (TPR) repeat protein